MTELLFLAVEEAIPADHPAALLAVPLGLLFMAGSVFMLLWSNYGAKKGAAIYGVAFFGFAFLLGVFWTLGGPGIPQGLGITHLPGERPVDYQPRWYTFEQGSERAAFFPTASDVSAFSSIEEYAGLSDASEDEIQSNPRFANLSGAAGAASLLMRGEFLPVDENNVAQIGVNRREQFERDAQRQRPANAAGRAQPFYTARNAGPVLFVDDAETGVRLAAQEFQAVATYVDADGVPLEPVPVGETAYWYGFYDPGAIWLPAALWTGASFLFFLLSLLWLDRMEMREKRLSTITVTEAERVAVPIAQ
ncbi:MAG: hypothetical protein WD360_04980 [Nitriliruptoraceae bacterium]